MTISKKWLAFVAGLLLIVGLGLLVFTNRIKKEEKPAITTTLSSPEAPSLPGKMAIKLTGEQTVAVGKTLTAEIVFESGGEPLAGVDAVLLFDPKMVRIAKFYPNRELFEQLPINRQKENEGLIKIVAFLPKKPLSGEQPLASFDFELLQNKPTVLTLKFDGPRETTDSNLITETDQQDILGQVEPLRLTP